MRGKRTKQEDKTEQGSWRLGTIEYAQVDMRSAWRGSTIKIDICPKESYTIQLRCSQKNTHTHLHAKTGREAKEEELLELKIAGHA